MVTPRADECRALLALCRPAWRAGHGDEAWAALRRAETLAGADPGLRLGTLAMGAGLHLLAEQPDHAATAAREAVELGTRLTAGPEAHDHHRHALADARVTLASLGADGPASGQAPGLTEALAVLDAVAGDPALAGSTVVSRAVNNALLLRLQVLRPELDSTPAQVEAWIRVSEARTLLRGSPEPGNITRIAVDLGMDCGQWERAWTSAQEQIAGEDHRNELIAVLAKAAYLAWHRELPAEARELGSRARTLSVAVDHPWVRTYAYLGGVIAAAASGGDLGRALSAYARCTSAAGHASRPHRAWTAASVALEAGHPVGQVEAFRGSTALDGRGWTADRAQVELADARGQEVDLALARRYVEQPHPAPSRARIHLAMARTYRRQDRLTAAAQELARARHLLRDWPGWLLTRVEQESALVEQPVVASAGQRRVLDLLAEGLGNAQIAGRLGLSPRTVAVHVAGLLRANDLPSRTALVAQHLRARVSAP